MGRRVKRGGFDVYIGIRPRLRACRVKVRVIMRRLEVREGAPELMASWERCSDGMRCVAQVSRS